MPRTCFAVLIALVALPGSVRAARQMENLSRGIVAVPRAEGGLFVSWRLFGTDPDGVAFNLYRDQAAGPPVKVNPEPLAAATCFVDAAADPTAEFEYFLRPVVEGVELASSRPVKAWRGDHLEIPIQSIEGYQPGDASMADLDGDGELEIVLHQVSRPRDNGSPGVTGEPVLDAYELDGTQLWRITLGKNIREGEHYTQFMVYDLDGDGRAEVVCKTADGTIDGTGGVIGDAEKDWRTLEPGSPRDGRILAGPEFLTVFDGQTGKALATTDYVPGRDPINGWGGIGGNAGNDSFGNRCDRFLACVAYLDGERPSVVMCRGVYGRIVLAAWDWREGRLSQRWVFDTGSSYPPFRDASPFAGMGGHSLSVGDVDGDGRDEIVYQAMVVDDDGTGLYSSGLRHGDAMHLTDIDPDRPGQEVFTVQENEDHAERFQTPGAALRDALTGEILWSHSPAVDVTAGLAADIDPRHRGLEAWGGPGGLRTARGEPIGPAPRETDWCIWWDGDPLRELVSTGRIWRRRNRGPQAAATGLPPGVDRFPLRAAATRVMKWNHETEQSEPIFSCDAVGASRGPALLGDLLGDWREELLLVAPDGKSLRLYTTTIPTDLRLPTLLHDPQYRLGIAWQNVVYNKPPHPGFYLGHGMTTPPRPTLRLIGDGEALTVP
ncbi:MAG: Rhamnogalacturonan endolyase YesW precursor [Planctomycetota bacterium]